MINYLINIIIQLKTIHSLLGKSRAAGGVGSDFFSAIAGRVGSTFRRVGSGPRKVTRGQLCAAPAPCCCCCSLLLPLLMLLLLFHHSIINRSRQSLSYFTMFSSACVQLLEGNCGWTVDPSPTKQFNCIILVNHSIKLLYFQRRPDGETVQDRSRKKLMVDPEKFQELSRENPHLRRDG